MTAEETESLIAAVAVKLELPVSVPALIRGLPKRHAVTLSLHETADYILARWSRGATETELLEIGRPADNDLLRDDRP